MSRSYAFRTSDVFTSHAYAGNQLGIITLPQSNPLSQSDKQKIAQEFNLSETIFVHDPDTSTSPAHVVVDIFTPYSEIPFAGHPTIGAIHHILTHLLPSHDKVIVDLKAGAVVGTLDRDTGFAAAEIPQEFHRHARTPGWDAVVASQPGLSGDGGKAEQLALVSIVRGMNFMLVDLSEKPEMLTRVVVTKSDPATGDDLDEGWPQTLVGTLFYVRKDDRGDGVHRFDQRVVVIGLEDPATGSASCSFTAYLALEMGGANAVHRFELIQGEQMGRKSVIATEVTLDEGGKKITKLMMSGQCKNVMKGEIEL
ncbi:hypothetical protein Dsin_032746 [Dipteronia sinensis]|uniref:Phenazine biosynthesis PhzC/PhzF protein n=1 Tax=Dipteronia sinensis TaxID=43782 RepID=A0AAD9ZI88_9ROSI|nr:hypothetical protein Dsin_032746 [Dipteronia sinensis]